MHIKYINCLLIICCLSFTCFAKEWRGIIPLKSTRADVEKLLGTPSEDHPARYDLPDEIVYVEYVEHPCNHTNPPGWPVPPLGWNVPVNTVIDIVITLKKPIPLNSLTVNLSDFKKVRGDDVPQHSSYNNEEEGFSIEVLEDGGSENANVWEYIYGPRAKDSYLRCPATPTK